MRKAGFLLVLAVLAGCREGAPPQGGEAGTVTPFVPERDLGPLFQEIQVAGVFPDSKTLVDSHLRESASDIVRDYEAERADPSFDLSAFVDEHFEAPQAAGAVFETNPSRSMEEHIRALWPALTRSPDSADAGSSLLPLPEPYVVPGGRFREVYYWDSYFTMLGLVQSNETPLVHNMLDNFAHLIRTVGHIPNGNRTYYLSRSQPPFFAAMVGLYATATDTAQALQYLDAMEREHDFWMNGGDTLSAGNAFRRVVRLADGRILNRYWDDQPEPRPESYREDFALGESLPADQRESFYRNVRASAESGWDFSSRWMRDPSDLRTLETTDLIPIDLNSLLYHQERTIAALLLFRGTAADSAEAGRYADAAAARRQTLLTIAFDPTSGYFYDVRWRTGERVTDRPTMAAAAVLYFGLATPEQGAAVAARLERDFLKFGGLVTTLITSGQQWDAPNGWAPLQWLGVQGMCRYGRRQAAQTARDRWLALNRRTFEATGKMTEKYDVVDPNREAGGGEYPTQDGFGWTNGVALAMEAGGCD